MRGRRADPPQLQAAKGNPGKRLTKAERAQAEANRLAESLASAPAESGDPLSPPVMMLDERLKPAITVWRSLSGELGKMNVLTVVDRFTFAIYCLSVADYFAAVDDILDNGQTYWATTHGGNKMKRVNPAVAIKERLAKFIFDAGAEFGLTPLARYSLLREQAAYGGGALPPPQNRPPQGSEVSPQSDVEDLIGFAQRLDSPPRLQ
jgi:P27 family predicted phage terminase small subunit